MFGRFIPILALSTSIFAVVFGASVWTYQHGANVLRERSNAQLENAAANAREAGERAMDGLVAGMEAWARQRVMLRILDDDPEHEITTFLETSMKAYPPIKWIDCVSAEGRIVGSSRFSLANPNPFPDVIATPVKTVSDSRGSFSMMGDDVIVTVPINWKFEEVKFLGALRVAVSPRAFVLNGTGWWSCLATGSGRILAQRGKCAVRQMPVKNGEQFIDGPALLVFAERPMTLPDGMTGPEWKILAAEPAETLYGSVQVLRKMLTFVMSGTGLVVVAIVSTFFLRQRHHIVQLSEERLRLEGVTSALEVEVTERRRVEEELRAVQEQLEQRVLERTAALSMSEERFRAVAENLGDGLLLTDLDDRVLDINPYLLRMTGYSRDEVIGRRGYEVFNTSEQAEEMKQKNAERAEGRSGHYEILLRRKDGSQFWAEITGAPVLDSRRNIFGTVGVLRDITQRKESEWRLAEVQSQLLATSRAAGMAEVATGVLHNVGNVLNSVNVSASVVQDRLKESKLSRLADAAKLLQEHEGDIGEFLGEDPKGKLLPGFLIKLSAHLKKEQEEAVRELDSLARNIEHIKEIVAMQQSYAKVSGVTEILSPVQVVEDVLRMNEAGFVRHGIVAQKEYGEVPAITMDKHKVMQIVVNLVRNAKHAVTASEREDKKLVVRVRRAEGEGVAIEVEDNGVGIAPENLTKIFGHGFTTKKEGHGFGLHSGALAAKEMGGSLSVTSDGPGRGSRFTLILPVVLKQENLKAA